MESGLNQSYVQKASGYSREMNSNYKNTFFIALYSNIELHL